MITVQKLEKACGCPALGWKGNCYGLACAIISNGLAKGHPVYGHYLGYVDPKGYWGTRAGLPFIQHGWVLTDDSLIIDPTRWVFENKKPYIAYFAEEDDQYRDYDDGGSKMRILMRRPPPDLEESDQLVKLNVSPQAMELVDCLLAGKGSCKRMSVRQLLWVANTPYDQLGIFVGEIYLAIAKVSKTSIAYIPKDYKDRAIRELQIDLF